jgi:hypothetical protein
MSVAVVVNDPTSSKPKEEPVCPVFLFAISAFFAVE